MELKLIENESVLHTERVLIVLYGIETSDHFISDAAKYRLNRTLWN